MIAITDLGFNYGRKDTVFSGLSLNIPQGRSVGVLGANGVGKSTLIKLLSGLVTPNQGSLTVLGHNPRRRETSLLNELFVLPEECELPSISGDVYIKQLSPFYPNFDQGYCATLLKSFSVDASKKLTKMSLGQKKKFLISFALATGCRLILMDEPTNGLDIPSKTLFRETIVKHQREDQTLLICTHQVRDLESVIDSVVLMNEQSALWCELADLPTKISQQFGEPDPAALLHSELRMGRQFSLVKNTDNAPMADDIDIELLFNCFHNNYQGLKSAITEEIA